MYGGGLEQREKSGEVAEGSGSLEQPEIDFHVEVYRDRLIAGADHRLEAPLAHLPDGALVQTHAQATNHAHIRGRSIRKNGDLHEHGALESGLPGLFRVGRLRAIDAHGLPDAVAPNVKVAAADPATLTRTDARTRAAAHAP